MHAFTFPGQGSQAVGMGKDLAEAFPAARAVFEEVDSSLDQNLSKLMFEGPLEDLTLTENSQPALMAVSMAVVRALEAEGYLLTDIAGYVAGHSLGEFSALVAVGTLPLSDACVLLKKRGQAMQRAVPVGEGAMAALLGLDFETAREVAQEAAGAEVCTTANDNAPGQVVISGHKDAVARAIEIAKKRGAKRGILLPVSAPFHCPLMAPAAVEMEAALDIIEMFPPSLPIISNVTALPITDVKEIRHLLVQQVTSVVRWRESILKLSDLGVLRVVECGAGKVLSGLAKRIDPTLEISNIQTAQDLEFFVKNQL
ncbi:MAG: ACP S-malonyltransferase [Alphaproteobacteria bacterium]|nr:MAG: ACP S-malonyltransferase [Alphaproteobacteria bacterium]